MNNTIFIPKKIKVGYQKREDTYTGQLAYIIYYDEVGKLRKETSWQSWRSDKIEPNDFENAPTEGFVLNKGVGGQRESWGWNARNEYIRVYDPRNFEFEISVSNLLYILENCSSIKGKGLEGEFVYGWEGTELILMPTCSPDYKDIADYSNTVLNNNRISAKDLVIGGTYRDRKRIDWIYMGRFDYWDYGYKSKKHYFINPKEIEEEPRYYRTSDQIITPSSIPNRFIGTRSTECVENYAELMDWLERQSCYSPINPKADEYKEYTLEELEERLTHKDVWGRDPVLRFYSNNKTMWAQADGARIAVSVNRYYSYIDKDLTIEELYNKYKPMYKNVYLMNGRLYKEEVVE